MLALIVIDQQKGIDHPKLGNRNNLCAENNILSLLDHWRLQQWPICHIKHRSTDPHSVFWPEQEGFDFKTDFQPLEGEWLIEKSVPCAFTRNTLESLMCNLSVDTLVIVGVATNNSVESTARSAGNLGFNAYVVSDACFAFAQQDYNGCARSAEDVHAMSLANLHGEYATVLSYSEWVQRLGAYRT